MKPAAEVRMLACSPMTSPEDLGRWGGIVSSHEAIPLGQITG